MQRRCNKFHVIALCYTGASPLQPRSHILALDKYDTYKVLPNRTANSRSTFFQDLTPYAFALNKRAMGTT